MYVYIKYKKGISKTLNKKIKAEKDKRKPKKYVKLVEKNINIKIKINLNGEKSEKERKVAIKSNLNECKTYKIIY